MHRIAALVAPAALLWQCFAAGLPSVAMDLPAAPASHSAPLGQQVSQESPRPKILEFYATWCEPCKQMKPTVDTLKERYGTEIEWVSCDVDDPANAELAKQYEICPIPALVFLNSQEEVVCYAFGCCQKRQEEVLVRQIEKIVPKKAIGVGVGAKGTPTTTTRTSNKRRKPTMRKVSTSAVRALPARRVPIAR